MNLSRQTQTVSLGFSQHAKYEYGALLVLEPHNYISDAEINTLCQISLRTGAERAFLQQRKVV